MLISVVIKAKNEARQIRECIESVNGFASEIVLVDDNSDDDTVKIATSCGARIVHARSRDGNIDELDFIGFNATRGEWIFRLDSDERLIGSLARELKVTAESGLYDGVRFSRKQIMFGAWAQYGGWFRNFRLGFFRKAAWDGKLFTGLHQQVNVRGKVKTLPAREEFATLHYDYDLVRTYIYRSLWKYTAADAASRYALGERYSPFLLLYLPVRRFLVAYFWHQGFRDGSRGLILAALMSAYELCIQTNLWDLARLETTPAPSSGA
jgi:(heptosyl)LPS beta-1,4-glucosyltransferase